MNRTAMHAERSSSGFQPATALRLLQRKCDCRKHTAAGGECEECASKKVHLQRKLRVGAENDPLEHEANHVADQVISGDGSYSVSPSPSGIQRWGDSRDDLTSGSPEGDIPDTVTSVLGRSGEPLSSSVRDEMEPRFGHDFSSVRVHRDGFAERSARDVQARAYAVGNNIVFGAGEYMPSTQSGRHLIAHELTHVVQQGASSVLARQPKQGGTKGKSPPAKKASAKAQICGRDSRKVAGNWIALVTIDVGANTLTIDWDDPKTAPAASAGTHSISPGAGKCCVDCNDQATSQASGSLCTPKGGAWTVDATGCALGGHPTAKNPTYFQRGGIAIHSGNTASPPRSHGCARTSVSISELIHDNVVGGKTKITSSGSWSSTKCYQKESSEGLVDRKDVCDGNKLKPPRSKAKPKDKAKVKGAPAPSTPSAPIGKEPPDVALLEVDDDGPAVAMGATAEEVADGPGPDNARAEEGPLGLADDGMEIAGGPEPDPSDTAEMQAT